ncbi:MAG: glycosyltransferase family 4 protein [Anaerolineaceae bacterium]|nr:glycosyltransferase family 4 protein [Anaerolineaceae bacterium]
MKKKSICLLPEAKSLGGPRTFQQNLIAWAGKTQKIDVHFDPTRSDIDAFLVIGGPKKYLKLLLDARRRGIPVVQRLNGMNWIHRVRSSGLKYSLHSEAVNLAIAFFRRFVCNKIIYQSPFCEERWNRVYGKLDKPFRVIFNGTDVRQFTPGEAEPDFSERIDFLLAEGSFRFGMDFGLEAATDLALALSERFPQCICMHVAGKTDSAVEEKIRKKLSASDRTDVSFEGVISREKLIALERNAAFFLSSEINAACPNALIEAMACGTPITGFDTGAVKDVTGDAGIIVPYGSNPWKLETPDVSPLVDAAEKLICDNSSYRRAARARAESTFPIEKMAEAYINFCLSD